MNRDVVKVSDLTKSYGEVLAVDRISFQVADREFFGFLGPNGAGKTTTIRMMTGVIKPDSGTATIKGYDILKDPLPVSYTHLTLPTILRV